MRMAYTPVTIYFFFDFKEIPFFLLSIRNVYEREKQWCPKTKTKNICLNDLQEFRKL